jgi:hypothetical protein
MMVVVVVMVLLLACFDLCHCGCSGRGGRRHALRERKR